MARETCSQCEYILTNCICDSLSTIANHTHIVCIRDKSERGHAKNTAKLIPLIFDNALLIDSDKANINTLLGQYHPNHTLVLYPDDDAVELTTIDQNQYTRIIVLDGSWKKAYKLLQQYPMLEHFQKVAINNAAPTDYAIRKAPRDDSMSTLEAVACVIETLEKVDTSAIKTALNALMEQQFKHMPEEVRARYQKD